MDRSIAIITFVAAVGAFGIFVGLAQAQVIIVPYFTPTRIVFQGLEGQYPMNGSMAYSISLNGYGSNCIAFEAEMFHQDSSLPEGKERVAYYSQIQDCRTINISQGPYNYTQDFSYRGPDILGKPGDYTVDVNVIDQITKQNYAVRHSFIVVDLA